jgi:hypothetical protein
MKLILLIILIVISNITTQNPGLKTVLSTHGINYVKDVAMEILRKDIQNIKVPDVHQR